MCKRGKSLQAVISWSGGKDCCLALYKALSDGVKVSHMVNFVNIDAALTMSHCLDPELIKAQAQALNLSVVQERVNWNTYEPEFRRVISGLRSQGIDTLITGDIDLADSLAWNRKMSRETGMNLLMPLENGEPETVLSGFIEAGFEAVIVCVDRRTPAKDWLGECISASFLKKVRGVQGGTVHICGEKGEYHTLVTDGPLFRQRIEILRSSPVNIEGYSYLNIECYRMADKGKKQT